MKLAGFINRHKEFLYSGKLDNDQFRAFSSLRLCRTPQAKGAVYSCDDCSSVRFVYHSCGHRFCPNCQNHRTTEWLYRQKQKLLPCKYYMVTFTLPDHFRKVPRKQLPDFYQAFFDCSAAALKEMTLDRHKGTLGMLGVLHTNTRRLDPHPHIHYIVPGVILNRKTNRVKKVKAKYFLYNLTLAKVFRGKFLERLKELGIAFPGYLHGINWNVNCKQKGNGIGVLEYLSRYLVKGVVSQKSIELKNGKVVLTYKESETGKMRQRHFEEVEFLEYLSHHVLPKGFRSVREFGFLAPAAKKLLTRLQLLLEVKLPPDVKPIPPTVSCPCCKGKMVPIMHKISEQWFKEKIQPFAAARSPPKTVTVV